MKLSPGLIKRSLVALAVGAMYCGSALASDMYINLTNNTYDSLRSISQGGVIPYDANTRTANFREFGYNQILATSVYDVSDGSVFGSFYDTNIPGELTAAGVPTSGLALDGVTTVNLVVPDCPAGQCDIDGLSPLVPPLSTDNEGFLQTWDLQVLYHFDGTLTAGGPVYTGGTYTVYFNDLTAANNDYIALIGTLTGSNIQAANLDLFFDVTYAAPGWLWVDDGTGVFRDASLGGVRLALDTNVNPPIPTADQLLVVGTNAIRQTTLDGSITAVVPEPGSLALVGLSLAAVGFVGRRRKQV